MAGYASVLALITAWVAQSEISQALQTGGFNQPIALVWLNHSILVLLLPLTLMVWHSDRAAVLLCRCCSMERPRAVPFRPSLCEAVWRSHRLSRTRLLVSACGLAIIYFLGDLVWYCALPHLSVATGTAMFNSSCAFTFAFGAWLLRERVSALKLIGVCVALIGVVVIALFPGANMAGGGGDSSASLASHLVAAALVLSAALLYGYYEVLFKVVVESGLHLPRSLCEMVCGCGFARAESRALLRGVVDGGRSARSSDELDLSSRSLTVEDALLPRGILQVSSLCTVTFYANDCSQFDSLPLTSLTLPRGILQTPPRGDAVKRAAANVALHDADIEGLMPPAEIVVAGMGADVVVTNVMTGMIGLASLVLLLVPILLLMLVPRGALGPQHGNRSSSAAPQNGAADAARSVLSWISPEQLVWPTSRAVWLALLLNASLSLVFNIALFLALTLTTSPLIVSVGCMLTIPITAVVDYVAHGDSVTLGSALGSCAVIAGFVCLTASDVVHQRRKNTAPAAGRAVAGGGGRGAGACSCGWV